jgi:hypothetical protein
MCPGRPRDVSSRLCGLAALLAVTGLLEAACGSASAEHPAGGPAIAARATSPTPDGSASGWPVTRGTRVKSTIVIDPSINETFAPPPAGARPKLDAVQALDAFPGRSRKDKPRAIPADVSYQLGLLTLTPWATDMLAWGYSSPPGPCPIKVVPRASILPDPSSPPTSRAPRRCIQWTFIDASNPGNNYGTWQPLGR